MKLAMCEVPVHPVEFLTEAGISSLPELPMTLDADGTYYCDGESTQETTEGYNLIDFENAIYRFCNFIDGSTGEIKSNISNSYFSSISCNYLSNYLFDNMGKTFTFCADDNPSGCYISIVVYGTRTSGGTNQETTAIGNTVRITISNDFESITQVEFRVNRKSEKFTDTTTVVKGLRFYLGDDEKPYEPYTGGIPSPNPDYSQPIVNTYPAGTYKAICGDKTYKVTLDDDLRSVPGVADRVRIDASKGVCWVERKVVQKYFSEFNNIQFEREKENTIVFNTTNNIPKPSEKECLCTHFTAQKDGDVPTIKILPEYHATIYFALYKTDASTLEELKTWIAENNPYLLYCIAPTAHQSIQTQLTTISAGRSVTIPNTVNDAVDMLAVKGDSWQLVQEEITDADGNVTQPAMPSPEYPSEIVSVSGQVISTNNGLGGRDKLRGNSITLPTLRSLPDGTRDVLYVDRRNKRAWVERCVKELILDANTIFSQSGKEMSIRLDNYPAANNSSSIICMCSDYEAFSRSVLYGNRDADGFRGISASQKYIRIVDNLLFNGDIVSFKEYVKEKCDAGTPITVCYLLEEPTIEELPYSDYLLQTAQYETNIHIDCNEHLEPEISATVKVLGR